MASFDPMDSAPSVALLLTGVPTPTTTTIPQSEFELWLGMYRFALTVGALLSVFASSFFIFRYLLCKKTRHHLTEIIQFRSVFDILYCATLIGFVAGVGTTNSCDRLVLMLQVFASASEIYAFVLSVDVVLAIVDPFTNFNARRWMYLVGVAVAASLCGLLVWYEVMETRVGSSVAPILGCGNTTTAPLNATNVEFWVEANLPAIILYLASFGNLVAGLCWLSRGVRLSDALAARRNAIKAGLRYLAGYFVYWLLIRVLFIYIKVADIQTQWWALVLHIVLIASRGLVTLFLWSLGTRPLRSCCGLRDIAQTGAPEGLEDTHTVLRQELLFYTKLGITVSVQHARKQRTRRRSEGIQAFTFALPSSQGGDGSDGSGNRAKSRTLFSPNTNTNSRRTLEHQRSHSAMPTASSSEPLLLGSRKPPTSPVAAHAKRRMKKSRQRKHPTTYGSSSGSNRSSSGGGGGGGGGGDDDDDDPVHSLEDDDAVAAEMSSLVNSTSSTADPKTVSSDVRWKTSLKASKSLIDGGSQVERSADMAGGMAWNFTDFCPQIFADIRRLLGQDDKSYTDALRYTSNEKFNSSASGSFFFFSKNRRFIVKTASRAECKFLLRIIGDYTLYLRDNPDTLLPKFYGCHSVKLYQREIFFVVMSSVFSQADPDAPLHVFDLKGSTVKRKSLQERETWLSDGSTFFSKTLKDLDFFSFESGTPRSKLPLPPRGVSQRLKSQLRRDCAWLRQHSVMDYSLLLGVAIETTSDGGDAEEAKSNHHSAPSPPNCPLPPRPDGGRTSPSSPASALGTSSNCGAAMAEVAGGEGHIPGRVQRLRQEGRLKRGRSRQGLVSMPTGIGGWVSVTSADGAATVCHLGLIDVLQQWNCGKKAERCSKIRFGCQPGALISAVNSEDYEERFLARVVDPLLGPDRPVFYNNSEGAEAKV